MRKYIQLANEDMEETKVVDLYDARINKAVNEVVEAYAVALLTVPKIQGCVRFSQWFMDSAETFKVYLRASAWPSSRHSYGGTLIPNQDRVYIQRTVLSNIAVKSQYRRRGLFKYLESRLIELASSHGWGFMVENAHNAHLMEYLMGRGYYPYPNDSCSMLYPETDFRLSTFTQDSK